MMLLIHVYAPYDTYAMPEYATHHGTPCGYARLCFFARCRYAFAYSYARHFFAISRRYYAVFRHYATPPCCCLLYAIAVFVTPYA